MINFIIRWSISNRLIVLLVSSLILLLGIISIQKMPVDAIPDLSEIQVIIKTSYPGQAPQVIEDQVTYPLTTAMLSVPKANTVRGFSFFGDSYVYIIFDEGTDLYWARTRVLEYLSQVSAKLPVQAKPELGPDATGVGWIYSYALIDETAQYDLSQLRSMQDWFLKFELQSVKGVAEVASVGGMVRQYQVILDPNKLRVYDIPLAHIRTAIERSNQEAGASVIEMAEAEYMVRASGYLTSIEDIALIPLGTNTQGTPLSLGDIADIKLGPQMRRGIAELNGQGEVTGGIIIMRHGENAQEVIANIKLKLSELKQGLPAGVKIIPTYDRSLLIDKSIDNIFEKILEEFIIVVAICALFLFRIRYSLVILFSLSLGILSAFIIMHYQGINANIMSLGGIAIAIGTMVDGSIVLIENIHKHYENQTQQEKKHNKWELIRQATEEVGTPLFFSLLIITVSFLPLFFLENQEGKLFAPLAYTKTYCMAAAAGITITLIPVLIGYFAPMPSIMKKEKEKNKKQILLNGYKKILHWSIAHKSITLVATGLILASAYYPIQHLGSEFMPPLDEGDLMYMPITYAGISIGKARQILQQTNKLITTLPEVDTVFGKMGRSETATDPAPLTMIESIIQFKPKDQWRKGVTSETLQEELNNLIQFPGLANTFVMPIKTRIDMLATGMKTPVGIKIAGPDLPTIENIGKQIEKILPQIKGTASVYSERVSGGRYLKIDIDRRKASRYQMNIIDIQNIIATAIGGINVTETVEGLERYPINIRYPQEYRDSVEQLKQLPIVAPNNINIALSDLANIYIEDGPPAIKSENARLNGWVYIEIENRDNSDYVKEAKAHLAQNLPLPPGYSIKWAGQYEYLERAKEKLSLVIPVTLLSIILLLLLSFRNIAEVAIILGTLPFALVGGLWFLHTLNYNFSVAVAVGFIALAGVTVEIGVLMLVYLNQAYKSIAPENNSENNSTAPLSTALPNERINECIIEGASQRLRPILMTTIATFFGLLPIMFGSGTGSEIMQRIAAPMLGGIASSLILTLIVLPVIYYLWRSRPT